jgi:uncharacterized membrane protein YdjX (TVP38/TMEM64 family)
LTAAQKEQRSLTPASTPPDVPPTPTRPAWSRWALAALLVLGVLGFYALGLNRYFSWEAVRANLDGWRSAAHSNLPLALLLFFLLYAATTALSLPVAAVLSLLAGALFGRWLGTGLAALSATTGATLAFLSSRYVLRDWVRRHFGKRLAALDRGVEQDGAYYLFTLRLVPVFPFFLINLGMGLTPMRVSTYAWVSLVGMLPGAFLYVNAGQALGTLDSPAGLISPGVLGSLALLGLAPLLIRKLVQWQTRERGKGPG